MSELVKIMVGKCNKYKQEKCNLITIKIRFALKRSIYGFLLTFA